jgi:hypothetical protein
MKHIAIPQIHIRISSLQQAYACMSLLAISMFAYLYFLNLSVVHVVIRKEQAQEMNQLHADIATLETSYIESQHKISDKMAAAGQYDEHTEKIFVTRGGGDNLAFRNN